MRVWYCDHFRLPLPADHRFPSGKYARLRSRVTGAGLTAPDCLAGAPAATDEDLHRAHDAVYVDRVKGGTLTAKEMQRIGFPWSPELVERSLRSAGGTLAAARSALDDGYGVHLSGGTHHAYRDRGEGFCIFNDVAVLARALQAEGRIERVVVIDCDVHQGNGTASIFAEDPTVFTFSIHCERNYPLRKERSDLDIALPAATGDADYLEALAPGVDDSLARAGADLAVYLAGADPHEGDRLGRLALTKAGLAERDRVVFDACDGAGLPVAVCMAGGYGRDVDDTVDIHFETVAEAARR